MKTADAAPLRRPSPRIGAADFAALFSGEDAPAPLAHPPGGLLRAAARLIAGSVRTLAGHPTTRESLQAFARRTT